MSETECPNGHGPLVFLKKPIAILYLLPEDICDLAELEGTETPEEMFGYIIAVCQECGFIYTTAPAYEYDYDSAKWRRCESDEEEEDEE